MAEGSSPKQQADTDSNGEVNEEKNVQQVGFPNLISGIRIVDQNGLMINKNAGGVLLDPSCTFVQVNQIPVTVLEAPVVLCPVANSPSAQFVWKTGTGAPLALINDGSTNPFGVVGTEKKCANGAETVTVNWPNVCGGDKEDDVQYVNCKQYHRILERRKQRLKLVSAGRISSPPIRKKYLHESRHLHAVNRVRVAGGRFASHEGSISNVRSLEEEDNTLPLEDNTLPLEDNTMPLEDTMPLE